jgi:hypothetical protein
MEAVTIIEKCTKVLNCLHYANALVEFATDASDTVDLYAKQPKLEYYMESMLPSDLSIGKGKSMPEIYYMGRPLPLHRWESSYKDLREFIKTYWFPTIRALRSEDVSEYVWYMKRLELLKLCVFALHFERFDWRLHHGDKIKVPMMDDVSPELLAFCHDAVYYGIVGWPALCEKMHAKHISGCEGVKALLESHYSAPVIAPLDDVKKKKRIAWEARNAIAATAVSDATASSSS